MKGANDQRSDGEQGQIRDNASFSQLVDQLRSEDGGFQFSDHPEVETVPAEFLEPQDNRMAFSAGTNMKAIAASSVTVSHNHSLMMHTP